MANTPIPEPLQVPGARGAIRLDMCADTCVYMARPAHVPGARGAIHLGVCVGMCVGMCAATCVETGSALGCPGVVMGPPGVVMGLRSDSEPFAHIRAPHRIH